MMQTYKKESEKNKPTSPHIQIYSWSISSLTSIAHRITGVMLYISIIAISWYVVLFTYQTTITSGEEKCDCPTMEIIQYIACAAVVAIIFALYYHFCNGVRHLFWDIGKGYDIKLARRTGILVFATSIILTALTIGSIAYFKFM